MPSHRSLSALFNGARLLRLALVLLATTPLSRAQSDAQGELNGSVTDETSRARLAAVEVTIEGTALRAHTARDGEFVLRHVPAGPHTVVFDYLGKQRKRMVVTIEAGKTTRLDAELGEDIVLLDTFKVDAPRSGQARALNEQRASQNLATIVSSDLSGQFPDKTIADAVKRLPGVTVETDTDTGGSEGRYITIRGMSSAFNAVSVNGVRVGIANADDTISRQVPLDVISAKSADTIIVTKTLRPDQDGDSIGGAVDILTRSALDRDGTTASAEFALGYRKILEDYDNYRYDNPNYEGAFSISTVLDKDRQWALEISANSRATTSQKQRASVFEWIDISETDAPQYMLEGFILQDFFDHLTNSGASAALDFRPNDDNKMRFNVAYNLRKTERGRQRQLVWFDDALGEDDFLDTAPTVTGDTVTKIGTTSNSLQREVREFHEKQSNLNFSLTGDSRAGDLTISYLAGYNRGQYKGDPDNDIWARFQTGFNSTNTYTISQGDAYFPTVTTSDDLNDPSLFMMRSVDLSTDTITDDEKDFGLDAKYDTDIAGNKAFFKAGAKARLRGREREHNDRYYVRNRDWTLAGYDGNASIPSLVADYRAQSLVNGRYDYGFYIDPKLTRSIADQLIALGVLELDVDSFKGTNNALYSYEADENIYSSYAMGQIAFGKLTVMSGVRLERTKVTFKTYQAVTVWDDTANNGDGDYVTNLSPISPSNSYTDVMPGLHLRYDVTKAVALRAAYTRSVARPTFSDLNPRTLIDRDEYTVSRGNLDLKPVTSDNFDLSVDYYLGSIGYVSAAVFHKKLKNNIYSPDGFTTVIDGETYKLTEPRNADGGHVTGIELGYEQPLTFLPAPFNGLGFSANWTHADSSVKTGYASVPEIQLFDQVKNTVNAGIFYDKAKLRFRLAWLYRSKTIPADYGINPTHPELGRVIAGSSTLDFTASYRFAKQWTVYSQFQNLLNTAGRAYDGDESLRLDYNEYTDWSAQIGIRWEL